MKKIIAVSFFSLFLSSVFAEGFNPPTNNNAPQKIRKRSARPNIPGMLLLEFGFSTIQDEGSLSTDVVGSRTINFLYFYDIQIAGSGFYFTPGVGLGLDRFRFSDDVTIERELTQNNAELVPIDGGGVQKSMLITNYIDFPLEVRYYANSEDRRRSFNVGLGAKIGVLYNSHTKIKQTLGKTYKLKNHDDFGINRFRYGITGRIGIGGFNLFVYKNINEIFEEGKATFAPDATTLTIGLSFTTF